MGKIHRFEWENSLYFDWAMTSIAMSQLNTNYQSVTGNQSYSSKHLLRLYLELCSCLFAPSQRLFGALGQGKIGIWGSWKRLE